MILREHLENIHKRRLTIRLEKIIFFVFFVVLSLFVSNTQGEVAQSSWTTKWVIIR